jgi:hypothetical protein
MSKNWNDFCCYCTGNRIKEIRECIDRNCPFFPFRRGGLEEQVEADICKKIVSETLTVGD